VLRADLWDSVADAPAAWAVLRVQAPGRAPVQGVADATGHVVVLFPYPQPLVPGPPIWDQTWTLRLEAAYRPVHPVPRIPDLCVTLSQPAATLWLDAAFARALTAATLCFGQDLVLRSTPSAFTSQQSVLLITPAGSPL
jgi:hypothetical protein